MNAGNIFQVPLQKGCNIIVMPASPCPWLQRNGFGKSTPECKFQKIIAVIDAPAGLERLPERQVNEARLLLGKLPLCERSETNFTDTPGERFLLARQRLDIDGTGQQELSRSRVLIDQFLDGGKQVRDTLNLVNN